MRSDRARGPFALVSFVLSFALTVSALLPPEHVHLAGIEGRTHSIVHRHSLEPFGPNQRGAFIATHGDHERALFLSTFYDSVSRFLTHAPASVEAAIVILPPQSLLDPVQPDDAHRAHGPPRATSLSRAPPSLA